MDAVAQYLQQQGIRFAYLFGSRARGSERPDSDFDIAVLTETKLAPLEALKFQAKLETDLTKMLGAPVDVVLLGEAGPTLRYEAVWKGRPLLALQDESRIEFELQTRRAFEDYRDIQRFYTEAMKERLGMIS